MKKITLLLALLPLFSIAQWIQVGDDIDGESANDTSGSKVALSADGSIVAIAATQSNSAAGQIRVFEDINGTWIQIGDDIIGAGSGFQLGRSLSLRNDGTIVAAGAILFGTPGVPSRGHVQVFENINGTWTQIGDDLLGINTNDMAGSSVSLNGDGNIVAMGARFTTAGAPGNSGYVQVFENNAGVWSQIGSTIYGEAQGDSAGGDSISLNDAGNILAIGAISNDGVNGPDSGHVRVFENINGEWIQIGQDIDGEASMDEFGISVSLNDSGTILAIGGYFNSGITGTFSGHTRVFEYDGSAWIQLGSDIDGEAANDFSGGAVSINAAGTVLAIGAALNDGTEDGVSYGHTRIFEYTNGDWVQVGGDIDGEAANDGSGRSVALSANGSTIAIGARSNSGNGNNAGHVRIYHNPILSTNDIDFAQRIKLYPNPSYGTSYLELGNIFEVVNVNIYDAFGKLIASNLYSNTDKIELETEMLSQGIYFIKIYSQDYSQIIKLIKEK